MSATIHPLRRAGDAPAFDLDALCAQARADLADDIGLHAIIVSVEVADAFYRARQHHLDRARRLLEA